MPLFSKAWLGSAESREFPMTRLSCESDYVEISHLYFR